MEFYCRKKHRVIFRSKAWHWCQRQRRRLGCKHLRIRIRFAKEIIAISIILFVLTAFSVRAQEKPTCPRAIGIATLSHYTSIYWAVWSAAARAQTALKKMGCEDYKEVIIFVYFEDDKVEVVLEGKKCKHIL